MDSCAGMDDNIDSSDRRDVTVIYRRQVRADQRCVAGRLRDDCRKSFYYGMLVLIAQKAGRTEKMSRNIKMILQYDGSRYNGWQKQGNTPNTIQEKIEQVLERMTGKTVEVHGSGRTDAGVHATGQVANAHLETGLTTEEIKEYLNQYLPEDILVQKTEEMQGRFHSRLNAREKIYTYRVDMAAKSSVFERKYVFTLGESLAVDWMREAAKILCGTHDFKSFCVGRIGKKTTVRTLYEIEINSSGTIVEMRFRGNGFLYNMVRIPAGTLIEVGQGKREAHTMSQILEAKDRKKAGFTAPAKGLFLTEVFYS